MHQPPFNVRVYAIIINENNEVLLSNEKYKDCSFIKFPGGGLEYGEGTKDGLIRECIEEAGMTVSISDHFYTTDFFQKSFTGDSQVISIYYFAQIMSEHSFPLASDTGFLDFHPVDADLTSVLSLPIDKVAGAKLQQHIQDCKK